MSGQPLPTSSGLSNPYDEVPFPSQPLYHAQPARLAAIATMLGMQPVAADRCRLLELGCASGGNLLPLAYRFGDSHFVGVDYSQVQINAARRAAEALGLANLELHCASITDLDDRLEPFDYVVCHGVYAWVPDEVQRAILSLCRSLLRPQGVAYVSYNTYPAWHLRSLARRLLQATPEAGSPGQRVARGRAGLSWLSTAIAGQQSAFARLLSIELQSMLRQPDDYLFHEYLESNNEPIYFHQFANRAESAGLRYLADSDLTTMYASNFGRSAVASLERLTDDRVATEQHLDLLCNRGFRRTLLCQSEAAPAERLSPERLGELYFSAHLVPRGPVDVGSWTTAEFGAPDGSRISHRAPPVKAMLLNLAEQWPRSVSIDELTDTVQRASADQQSLDPRASAREVVAQNVVQCVASGLVHPTSVADDFVTTVSPRPCVSPLARFQARTSASVTNCRHESATLDEQGRRLLGYLDGSRDQDALVELLADELAGDGAATGPKPDATTLRAMLQQWLTTLASQALLVDLPQNTPTTKHNEIG